MNRAKPFVAYISEAFADGDHRASILARREGKWSSVECRVPVVVTPLLEGDPRPGDVLTDDRGREITVVSAPHWDEDTSLPNPEREVVVRYADGITSLCSIRDLTRVPPEKTYRFKIDDPNTVAGLGLTHFDIRATSKEEAVAKLAEVLEEVE